jgi:hypothetical protein
MTKDNAGRKEQTVYKLGMFTYLPHYTKRKVFVGPGYNRYTTKEYSTDELLGMGAVPKLERLLERVSEAFQ